MGIRPGEPWGVICDADPDVTVSGDDAALLAAATLAPGRLIRFKPGPSSQIGPAIGLSATTRSIGIAVPMDLLALSDGRTAVNMVILGTTPQHQRWYTKDVDLGPSIGKATGIVVANGQFLGGLDVVPRGHPGDGRAEVHTYRMLRRERAGMRSLLASGGHVPHPRIETRSVRSITISPPRHIAIELDGRPAGRVAEITITVIENAYRLLL